DNFINKVITVGTPYLGSDLKDYFDEINKIYLKNEFNEEIKDLIGINPIGDAAVDLKPNSNLLNSLNFIDISTTYVAVHGDISGKISLDLFNLKLEKSVEFGDGVVSKQSATYLTAGQKPIIYGYSSNKVVNLKIIGTIGAGYMFAWSDASILSLPYSHNQLLSQDNVKSR